jgi:hypothetical protein
MTTDPERFSYRIVDVWDNGEFLTGATLECLQDGEVVLREKFHGTSEFPPGWSALELARSAGAAWYESSTTTLEERLGPFGIEWEREQIERREAFA